MFPLQRIQATIEELVDMFPVRSKSYKKGSLWVMYPSVIARQQLSKDIAATKNNCWRRRFLWDPISINAN
jgi:hypothetical protein